MATRSRRSEAEPAWAETEAEWTEAESEQTETEFEQTEAERTPSGLEAEPPEPPSRATGRRAANAIDLAYRFIAKRERSVQEVRRRLERAQCPEPEIEAAVAELCELGYLDDQRYARLFAADKRNLEGWGSGRIARGLRERGIAGELIAQACSAQDGGERELERALALLTARFPNGVREPAARRRAFAMLARKGYGSELAGQALGQYERELEPGAGAGADG